MESHYILSPAIDLDLCGYERSLEIQRKFVDLVKAERIQKALIFVTHPPVYTIGRKADPRNYPGLEPVATERGGDITYHGPGQIVVYPIIRIGTDRADVRKFVNTLQETVETVISLHGYITARDAEPGIWIVSETGKRKVGSIGLALDHYVSYHGIAINLSEEVLEGFSRIRPCGLEPDVMGFVRIGRDMIKNDLIREFSRRFGDFNETDINATPLGYLI
ncbi:MAG TPA: lipoyl(octanoyl) transferase LipB [Thermoplasmataceae archaeon]|nr:lipoyl(octanoyl) transferase LipB [Thermoplasmatales archaeon AK]HLH86148.1 lipoyl(octanoyl) transferase LipB [Thermoplasmataceae archaeon]